MSIKSLKDIQNLKVKTMKKPANWKFGDTYQCDACDECKEYTEMYSHDWCKTCYKDWLKCKYLKKNFIPPKMFNF